MRPVQNNNTPSAGCIASKVCDFGLPTIPGSRCAIIRTCQTHMCKRCVVLLQHCCANIHTTDKHCALLVEGDTV